MAKKEKREWDGLCFPCKKIGVCATGSLICLECRHIFCANCSKIHKAQGGLNHILQEFVGFQEPLDSKHGVEIKDFKYDKFGNEEKDLQKIRMNYIKAISNEHDHTKHDYPDEIFCPHHKEVFCKQCKFRHHSFCSGCIGIDKANEVFIESAEYIKTISRLKSCHKLSRAAMKRAKQEKKYLNSNEVMVLQQIKDLKYAMIRHFNKLEQEVLQTLYPSNCSSFQNLIKAENILKCIKDSSDEMLGSLRNKMKGRLNSSSFKVVLEYRMKSFLFKNMLNRIPDNYKLNSLNEILFEPEYTVEFIQESLKSLGSLNVNKFHSQLPSILMGTEDKSITEAIEVDDVSIAFDTDDEPCDEIYLKILMDKYSNTDRRISRWSNPDFPKYGIVKIACLDKDHIVALDRTTCSVIIIDSTGNFISFYDFECIPWGMARYNANTVAVTVPGESKLFLIAVEFDKLVLQREIKCSSEPSSITGNENSLYITSYPWSDKAAIHQLDDNGNIVKTLDQDDSGKRLFKAPLDIVLNESTNDLFVCDSALKMLIAFDQKLVEKFRVDLEYMGHPSSLTLGENGNIYICGKLSNVIFQIVIARQSGRILFTENDGLSRPQALCNIPGESSLCVLCARENTFKIFKLN